ncbi:MAG: heparinase II/III family protein [Candidatus Ornithospirochaeta sp.]|nr:heparinase II/III family protein [Candidatus Ornithospirochaeta sp.]
MSLISAKQLECIRSSSYYSSMVSRMAEEIDSFMPDWKDDRRLLSGWGHAYFCNDDGGRLIFDQKKPYEHVCSICGKVYKGHPWDSVWVYFLRNNAIVTALKAAVVYKVTGRKEYLEDAKRIISFYAENYTLMPLHNKEYVFSDMDDIKWGSGRMMPQSLNESIVMIRIIQALMILDDDLDDSFRNLVKDRMMRPMIDVMKGQVDQIHNIRVWILCAIGAMSLYLDDKELYSWVFKSEFGMDNQLRKGVTSDYFWYEGSIHYNFFLLEGVVSLMAIASEYGAPFGEENTRTVERMLSNAYYYAFDNDVFPNPNDGWPNLNLKTFGYVYQMAARTLGEKSEVAQLLKNFMDKDCERTTLPLSESYYCQNRMCLEELIFNSTYDWKDYIKAERSSYNYPKSNFAMLRSDKVNVFVKYGLNGPSHAHPDILGIEVSYAGKKISRDISNAGYNSTLCRKWHRRTLAHNAFVVDGMDQSGREPGYTLHYDGTSIDVANDSAYPGVKAERRITLENSDGFRDHLEVRSNEEHTVDYVFHLENDFTLSELDASPSSLGFGDSGYEYARNVRKVASDGDAVVIKASSDSVEAEIRISSAGKDVFVLETMDNPVSLTRTTIIVRAVTADAVFDVEYSFKEK